MAQDLQESLGRLEARIEPRPPTASTDQILNEAEAIVVGLEPPEATLAAVERLAQSADTVVIIAVTPSPVGPEMVRSLYKAGASAVFEWPSEAADFADLVAGRLGIASATGVTSEADTSLARTVEAHLRLVAPGPSSLEVMAQRGEVRLRGTVDALWKRSEVEDVVRAVPGVRRVVSREVRVEPPRRSDEAIDRDIRAVLAATSEVGDETLAVSVAGGVATVAGTAGDHAEVERILTMLRHIKGLRGITPLMTVSPKARPGESALAERLTTAAERLHQGEDLEVSVFGDTAVVRGRVKDGIARGLITQLVRRDPAISQVVDKLKIEPQDSQQEPSA